MNRVRAGFLASALVALVGAGIFVGGVASASPHHVYGGASRASNSVETPGSVAASPVGTWKYLGSSPTWTFTTGGGWSDSIGNTGNWVQQGLEISVTIESGQVGCNFLGGLHLTAGTINSATKEGPAQCSGSFFKWYATK